jgi:hypothetical protein
MESRQHLSFEGLNIILSYPRDSCTYGTPSSGSYYAAINYGVSSKIASIFPNIVPVMRPLVTFPAFLHPQWITGFADGDGGFTANLRYYTDTGLFKGITYCFHIAQHSLDILPRGRYISTSGYLLLNCIISFFHCGHVYTRSNLATPRSDFKVQDLNSILTVP